MRRRIVPFRRRRWRRGLRGPAVVLGALLVGLPLIADATIAVSTRAEGAACRVVRIVDGDTVDLWCAGQGLASARLTGFDTPELFSPACAAEARAALAAKWALRGMLWRAERLAIVIEGRDRYDRLLAEVSVDGEPLARRMVAAGYARAYDGGARQGWC